MALLLGGAGGIKVSGSSHTAGAPVLPRKCGEVELFQ
nr:MAG TPA: hypothetical protein [Caudoviricetes sp.]